MDRSRRDGRPRAPTSAEAGARSAAPPRSSRLTLRKTRNRRKGIKQGSLWSRLPRPAQIADACGRAVRRSLPAVAAVAVLAVLGGGAWAGHRWLTRSPRFAITEITVRGAHRTDPDALRARLPIHLGDNAFADLTEVARAVRSDPWIASAEVRRVLPHTISIDLREREAAAVVELGDRYLVDLSGRPFMRTAPETSDDTGDDTSDDTGDHAGAAGDAGGLPLITGLDRAAFAADPAAASAQIRDALAALGRWRAADRPAIAEIQLDPHGAITLHSRAPSIAIQLGITGGAAGARIRAFDTAWAGLSDAERTHARAIHLDTRPDHVTVALAKD
jgi:cell division protein FtsQ